MRNADMNHARPDLSPAALFGDLPILRLCMEYEVDDPELLPKYLGSSWRGVLGWQMQRLCCPFGPRHACSECLIRDQCPYFLLYEAQSDVPGFRNAPRPFILMPEVGATADRQYLTITLFGRAVRTAPLLWKAIQEAEQKGLGRERVRFQVHTWEEERPGQGWVGLSAAEGYRHIQGGWVLRDCLSLAPSLPWKVRLNPPMRLRAKGRNLTVMDWPFVLSSLAQRLEMLSVIFHQGKPLGREGWTALRERFAGMGLRVEMTVAWKDWSRYSNRQRKKVPMGGLAGEALIHDAPVELWDWLRFACLVHVGKGAVMGLGRIALCDGGRIG